MFLIRRPSPAGISDFIRLQENAGFSYPEVGATARAIPSGYNSDRNSVRLGTGARTFRKAVASLRAWKMLELGWVTPFPSDAPQETGTVVAILANHFGFWSLNACRIVYVFEEPRRYGFAYGTLEDHAERGEERFAIEWSSEDDSVAYSIVAFSRPEKWPVRVAPFLGRSRQRRFARESMAAMKRSMDAGFDGPLAR